MASAHIEFVQDTIANPPVRGFLHIADTPAGDGLVLAHSASGTCEAPLLVALATAFAAAGVTVLRCDLPFRQLRPHGPPTRGSAERDQEGLRRALAVLRQRVPGRVFLGGHSYGGRQASMLAASDPSVADGILLLSYPLHPPRQRDELRTAHFPKLRTPTLFVHGMRDGFGAIQEMTEALKLIPARTELLPITAAGHSLLTSRNRSELPGAVLEAFRRFLLRS